MEVQGKMNAEQYCQILENALEESFENLDMPQGERIFQQDNDPKLLKEVIKYFKFYLDYLYL